MKKNEINPNLSNIFCSIDKYSSNIAIITKKNSLTYKELTNKSDELILKATIEKRKSLFLVVCTNSLISIMAYIGIIRSNNVALLIRDIKNEEKFNKLIRSYQPKYIFCPISSEKFFINMNFSKMFIEHNYVLLINDKIKEYIIHPELSLLLGTSGSTGSPKHVRLSHQNLKSNANSIIDSLKINNAHRAITTMPMSYSYGLSIINSHFLAGASIVITDKSINEKEFWDLLTKYNVTCFGGVPILHKILLKLKFGEMKLPNLKYITQAGGKLDNNKFNEIYKVCKKNNINFISMYGQTEASPRISTLDPKYLPSKIGSIGKPIKNGKLYLIQNNGKKINNSNKIGELIFEGKNVCHGYAEKFGDLKKNDENKGILKTGDLATFDDDGFYYIMGRKNRFIKIYGHRVNLDEIEEELLSMNYVCACTGDEDYLNVYFADKQNKLLLLEILEKILGIKNAKINIFDQVNIPKTSSGKTNYNKLN